MANVIEVTKLLEGPRHVILQAYIEHDGFSQELKDFVLYDGNTETDQKKVTVRLTVEEILFHFAGFDATLSFDSGLVDKKNIWVLPEGAANHVDFRPFGGFKDRSELDGTGILLINTNGFTDSNAKGSLIIKLRKD